MPMVLLAPSYKEGSCPLSDGVRRDQSGGEDLEGEVSKTLAQSGSGLEERETTILGISFPIQAQLFEGQRPGEAPGAIPSASAKPLFLTWQKL